MFSVSIFPDSISQLQAAQSGIRSAFFFQLFTDLRNRNPFQVFLEDITDVFCYLCINLYQCCGVGIVHISVRNPFGSENSVRGQLVLVSCFLRIHHLYFLLLVILADSRYPDISRRFQYGNRINKRLPQRT